MKLFLKRREFFFLTALAVLSASHAQAGIFGSKYPKTEEYPKIQEIEDMLNDIDLSSKKETIKSCVVEIIKDLPKSIMKVDEHLVQLDTKLESIKLHVRNTNDLVIIARRVGRDLNNQMNKLDTSGRVIHSAVDMNTECTEVQGKTKLFNADADKTISRIFEDAKTNTQACVNRLTNFKRETQAYMATLEGGSAKRRLADEMKSTDLAIKQLGDTQNKISEFKAVLFDRYNNSIAMKTRDNNQNIEHLKAGEDKCSALTSIVAKLEKKVKLLPAEEDALKGEILWADIPK